MKKPRWFGSLARAATLSPRRAADTLLLQSWRLYRRLRLHYPTQALVQHAPPGLQRLVGKIKGQLAPLTPHRLLPQEELYRFYRDNLQRLVAKHGAASMGDYLEFGVYTGTSLTAMYRALQALGLDHVRLFGFDSFEGLPPDEEGYWGPGGRFKSGLEFTQQVLAREGIPSDRVTLVKGFYSDSLTPALKAQYQIRKASVIMVDCDLYRSTQEALAFAMPLVGDEAFVVFDDWFPLAHENKGEKRAFEEFLQRHPHYQPVAHEGTYASDSQSFWVTRTGLV
jgi:O-methyltransferase